MKRQNLILTITFCLITTLNSFAQFPMQAMTKFAGEWTVQYTMWMSPTDTPMSSPMKAQREMIMNGLFFVSRFSGVSMGMNYEAISTIGYNLEKKVFVSSWIDNMNSGISYSEGTVSADGKKIEFHGTALDFMSGKEMPTRLLLTLIDDTYQKLEFFKTTNGVEMKTEEFTLAKK